jgi:hypothetical protein
MTRRLFLTLALLAAGTFALAQKAAPKKAVAMPQTPRQALIEMLTTKSDKIFEAHLPDALLVRLEGLKSKDARTGKTSSPVKTANTAVVDSKDAHFFPTGPTFLVFNSPKTMQKVEVTVDRDDLTAENDDLELGFRITQDGKESVSAFTPKLLVRMKQEGGAWRLAEVGFIAKLQLDDGQKLDTMMNSIMTGMASMQQAKHTTPTKD